MAGWTVPLQPQPLQTLLSEPIPPAPLVELQAWRIAAAPLPLHNGVFFMPSHMQMAWTRAVWR